MVSNFIGYTILRNKSIATLLINSNATTNINRKGIIEVKNVEHLCNEAYVVDIRSITTGIELKKASSLLNNNFIYEINKLVRVENYDVNDKSIYAPGISFYLRKKVALGYINCMNSDGVYDGYYDNGRLYETCNYVGGIREGNYIRKHENGELAEISFYINGKYNGIRNIYYNTGQLLSKCNYTNDVFDGKYEQYHPNDMLFISCHYTDGKLNGKYDEWDKYGKIKKSCNYNNGRIDMLYFF